VLQAAFAQIQLAQRQAVKFAENFLARARAISPRLAISRLTSSTASGAALEDFGGVVLAQRQQQDADLRTLTSRPFPFPLVMQRRAARRLNEITFRFSQR